MVRWSAPPTDVLAEAGASPLWAPAVSDARRRWLTGTGMAMGAQGNGLGDGLPDSGGGRGSLTAEGRIRLEFGFADYGQNLAEAITCLVCETLGCVAGDIDVVLGNSRGPDSGPTSASRSSVLIHGVLADILPRWKDRVRDQAAVLTGLPCDQLYSGPGGLSLIHI